MTSLSTTQAQPVSLSGAMQVAIRGVALVTALCALAAIAGVTGARLDRAMHAITRTREPVYLPRAEYLQPMSLGWRNVLADIIWFRTISYFGEHYRGDRIYPWLAQMCELVTDLDPRAEHVYRFAGAILPWEADQVDAGMRLLEKGVQQFPDSWTLRYYLGFEYYFFKNDNARALEHLRRAMQLPGVHPSIGRLVAVLAAEQYGPTTTLAFLAELERDVDSADLREMVRENMRETQLAATVKDLGAAVDAYKERTGSLPPTVDALVTAGIIAAVPADPFGGTYVIDPNTGAVRSTSGREPSRLHRSRAREKAARGESVRDLGP
jgi:hypothetical protein